ncbi:MAG: DUF4112 domain-containing protein [Verrucomicrobiota bacterium]|nr:DUF4112 domain-containing protein [Verrucomicrobiota bacterium]
MTTRPEVYPQVEPENREATLQQAEKIANILDACITIPGTKFKIGLDPILGLIPGLGDAIAALFSAYIIMLATRWGLPQATIVRMATNLVIDLVIGIVPVAGDIADAFWKSNLKNVKLLREGLNNLNPSQVNRAHVKVIDV